MCVSTAKMQTCVNTSASSQGQIAFTSAPVALPIEPGLWCRPCQTPTWATLRLFVKYTSQTVPGCVPERLVVPGNEASSVGANSTANSGLHLAGMGIIPYQKARRVCGKQSEPATWTSMCDILIRRRGEECSKRNKRFAALSCGQLGSVQKSTQQSKAPSELQSPAVKLDLSL